RLVVKILPLAAHGLMRFRQQLHGLAPPITALLTPTYPALGSLKRALRLSIPAGMEYARAIREGNERLKPRAMPASCPVAGSGCTGMSAHEKQTYQPSASLETVTVLGVPSIGRDQRRATRPILERTRYLLSSVAPLPNSL